MYNLINFLYFYHAPLQPGRPSFALVTEDLRGVEITNPISFYIVVVDDGLSC